VYFEGIDCPSAKLGLVILIVMAVLLLSDDIDLSDLEHARLIAASEIAPERNKNCPVLSCISGCSNILAIRHATNPPDLV